jgi:hypothetical protein
MERKLGAGWSDRDVNDLLMVGVIIVAVILTGIGYILPPRDLP